MVASLLESQPNLVDAHGNTPVSGAIGTGRLDGVECLVRRGADPLQANRGGSTLMDAAIAGHLEEVCQPTAIGG